MSSTRFVLVAGSLLLAACGRTEMAAPETAAAPAAAVRVTAAGAAETEWPETFVAPGTLRARTTTTLASRAMGYIREVRLREGDRVEAGAVAVTLEASELYVARQQALLALEDARAAIPEAESGIASATAQLELAETTLGRIQDLLNKHSVSQQEFDEAASRVKVARSAHDMAAARRQQIDQKIRLAEQAIAAADVQIGYLEVKAPFAGRVVARKAEPGMLASPGSPLLVIEQEGVYRLEAAVPEAHLRSARLGQSVRVEIDALSTPLTGRIEEIVPEIDPETRSFTVKVSLPARPELRSGLFGRAVFATATRRVLTIPREAVREQGQLRTVLTIENGTARSRMIRTGMEREGHVEVLSGLAAGERVVSPLPAGLADGQRVEAAQ
jgi:RND family efflux transporter MFP subunit